MKTYELYSGKRGEGNGSRERERSVDDIERDLGNIRSEMSSTLRAIESKLTGGDVVGQIMGQLRGGSTDSGELLRNVGHVARANPIPVALIATGLGAMLLAGSEGTSAVGSRAKQRARERVERYRSERASSQEGDTGERAREAKGHFSERARGLKESAGERLHRGREGAGQRLQGVQSRARESSEHARERLRHGSGRAREGLRTASSQGRRVISDEPLFIAGLGLAMGAMISGSIPLVREGRERYRDRRSESRGSEMREQAVVIEEIQIASEQPSSGIEWQEEPTVGPDVRRPEYPEDPTPYR
jgi:ElaB/YqjD/DUF883 family membrane-anchored ribosome-binding protein